MNKSSLESQIISWGLLEKQEIDENISNINVRDEYGRTYLHYAAKHRYTAMIKYLLSRGCNPDIRDHNQLTPSQFAFSFQSYESIMCIAQNTLNYK